MSDELFVQVPDAVLLDPNLTLSEYKLWCYLQYRYFLNHSRPITMSYADIGQAIHMGHNTIPDACKGLTEHGYLDMTSGGLGPNGKKYANTYVPLQGHRPKEGDDIRVLARNPKEGDDRSKEGDDRSKQGGVRPKQGCLSYKERDKENAAPPPPTSSPDGSSASSGRRSPEDDGSSSLVCSSGEPQARQEPVGQTGGSPAVSDKLVKEQFDRIRRVVATVKKDPRIDPMFVQIHGFIIACQAMWKWGDSQGEEIDDAQTIDQVVRWIYGMGWVTLQRTAARTLDTQYPPEWSSNGRTPAEWFAEKVWNHPGVVRYRTRIAPQPVPVVKAPVPDPEPEPRNDPMTLAFTNF